MNSASVESVDQDSRRGGLVWWNHTEIEAPYAFTVEKPQFTETDRGTAYNVTLVHPTHGRIGFISHHGDGGMTRFEPLDSDTFGVEHLMAFAADCYQDGAALSVTDEGFEYFLEEVVTQCLTDHDVAWSKAHGGFLVRAYTALPELNYGDRRGEVMHYKTIKLDIHARESVAARLNHDPDWRLPVGGHWQMFNGEAWTLLAPTASTNPTEAAQRTGEQAAVLRAIAAVQSTEDAPLRHAGPILNGMYATSIGPDTVELVDDALNPAVLADQWCHCKNRRVKLVRFQRWNRHRGLVAAGTIHASRGCRRLVTID